MCGLVFWRIADAITVCRAVAPGDLDGDGDLDALAQGDASGAIWLNDGTGRFAPHRRALSQSTSGAVALGDMDGDGDPDIVVGRGIERPQVWMNDGTGRFLSPYGIWIWAGLAVVAVAAPPAGLWWLKKQRRLSETTSNRG
jgi:hypothetical protein